MFRTSRRHRGARLAAALLPLPGLLAPVPAYAAPFLTVSICGADGEQVLPLPTRESPSRRSDDQPGCAHFVCPRERGQSDPADDED